MGFNLQRDLKPLTNSPTIGTATQNNNLNVLGETRNFMHLSFPPLSTKFKVKPAVVANLSMNINIAGTFLKRHNIDQLHSEDCLRIQTHKIPLHSQVDDVFSFETTESVLKIDKAQIVPPFSQIHCNATVTSIQNQQMPSKAGSIIGSIDFMDRYDCHPWINAIATPDEKGIIPVGIMNTKPYAVYIPANTTYGNFKLTCPDHQASRYPWRIAMVQSDNPVQTSLTKTEKLHTIRKVFSFTNSLLTSQYDIAKAEALLLKYYDAFSFDGSFGATTLLEHTIYTENQPPINLRYRPVNPSLEPHLKTQIDEWLKHDVIEPSSSPYNFPLVCVTKKNGKFRWCIDYRELNKISKRDTYPIGNIEDNLARLANSTVFSGLDGSGAFHVVPLSPESKEKTAFSTPFGLYQFKRLPFGLANGPSTYARLIKMVLSHIPTSVAIPYIDDTIIHSPNVNTHFRDLANVLDAHLKAGLKLQPAKCQLFQSSIDYLGHRVSSEGIAPLQSHTSVIKTWPMPTNRNEIRSFLGKVGYYRRFIKDFAGLARPLTDKLSQDGTDDKHYIRPLPN